MAQFNPKMSEAPNTFRPITGEPDNTVANAINSVGGLLQGFSAIKGRSDAAAAQQQNDSAIGGLFADTLRTEADVIGGQQSLIANQQKFDQLYSDGVISADERKELAKLERDRGRLENVTNSRSRQVQLRMKYANFVNRFPHLTKEARVMFGDADTRLQDVAKGAQGLVDNEAFAAVYGKEASLATAEEISKFNNFQKFKARRSVGTQYGEANFKDWSNDFEADVTLELFSIGQRMQRLNEQQGSIRQVDIDAFSAQLQTGYMDAVRSIDQTVIDLQQQGQYVSNEMVNALKSDIKTTRDEMMKMSEGKDFATRLARFNTTIEQIAVADMRSQLGGAAKLFAGSGGGSAKGAADIATLQNIVSNSSAIVAAGNLPAPYGDSVRMIQEGAIKYLNYLDTYDSEQAAQFVNPAMARQLAAIQGTRIDNGLLEDQPEGAKTSIELMEQGGTSDEVLEGINSRASQFDEAATKNNETKAKLSSTINNYALETEQLLQDVNGRIRETPEGPEVVISTVGGRLIRSAEATKKLRNTMEAYKNLPSVGSLKEYESLVERYKTTRNEQIRESITELKEAVAGPQGVNTQLLSRNLRQLKIQFGLTDQEVAEISAQIRSETNGNPASGDGD